MSSVRLSVRLLMAGFRALVKAVMLCVAALLLLASMFLFLALSGSLHKHTAAAQSCPVECQVSRVCRTCAFQVGDGGGQVSGCDGALVPAVVNGQECRSSNGRLIGYRQCTAVRNSDGSGMLSFRNNCAAGNPPALGFGNDGAGAGGDGGTSGGGGRGGGASGGDGDGGNAAGGGDSAGADGDNASKEDSTTTPPAASSGTGLNITLNSTDPSLSVNVTTPEFSKFSATINPPNLNARLPDVNPSTNRFNTNIALPVVNNALTVNDGGILSGFIESGDRATRESLTLFNPLLSLTTSFDFLSGLSLTLTAAVASGVGSLRATITSIIGTNLEDFRVNTIGNILNRLETSAFSGLPDSSDGAIPRLRFSLPGFSCGYGYKQHYQVLTRFMVILCTSRGLLFTINYNFIFTPLLLELIRFFVLVGAYFGAMRVILIGV